MALEFSAELPTDVPSSLPVLALLPPEQGPSPLGQLMDLAKKMGLNGRAHETRAGDDFTVYRESAWELGIHSRSSALVGRHRKRYQRPADRPFEMSDDEAVEVARGFVERVELVALDQLQPHKVTHLQTAGGEMGGEAKETTLVDAGVISRRWIDKIPVDGPGGHAMVNVDALGEVVGFRAIWRPNVDVVTDVDTLPVDVAHEAMQQIAKRVRGDVEVTRAGFGYFEQGLLEVQAYLQPAYVLVYVVRDEETAFRSVEVIAGSEKVFEPLMGPKRFGDRRQKPREPVG